MSNPESSDINFESIEPNLNITIARLSDIRVNEEGIESEDIIDFVDLQDELSICFGNLNYFIADKRISEYQYSNEDTAGFIITHPDSINGTYNDICVKDIGEGNKLYARFSTFKGVDLRSPYRNLAVEGFALIPIDKETDIVAEPEAESINGSQFFDDDKYVEELDTILLNGEVDIDEFESFVTNELAKLSPALYEEYLAYATKLFKNITVELTTNRVFHINNNSEINICSDSTEYLLGTIDGINLMSVKYDKELDETEELRLSFVFNYKNNHFCILAEDVLSIVAIN